MRNRSSMSLETRGIIRLSIVFDVLRGVRSSWEKDAIILFLYRLTSLSFSRLIICEISSIMSRSSPLRLSSSSDLWLMEQRMREILKVCFLWWNVNSTELSSIIYTLFFFSLFRQFFEKLPDFERRLISGIICYFCFSLCWMPNNRSTISINEDS